MLFGKLNDVVPNFTSIKELALVGFVNEKQNHWQKTCFHNFFFDFFKFLQNFPKWCRIDLGVSFGSQGISFTILDHLQTIFENFSKSQNPLLKLHFACQNAFFVHVEWFNEPSDYVLQTNPRSQKDYGSLSKTSRARFFILILVFEKINFFRSHKPECSKITWKLHMS